jgi:photosystem II CP43 chlorophyll apoprotein
MLWAGSMCLFEVSHFLPEKSLYDQGFILIEHLCVLGFGVGTSGEINTLYSFFVISVLHIISSGILSLGGIYHSIFGPETLDESDLGFLFSFQWQDRFRVSAILGAHLSFISLGSGALFLKGSRYAGLYDTWCSGGGDVRLLKFSNLVLNPYVLSRYLFRAPFGGEGWIVSVNNLEDLVGAHFWVSLSTILGSVWHIISFPLPFFCS